MTEHEAIRVLKEAVDSTQAEYDVAFDMAIKALKKHIAKEPSYQGEHEKCPTCGSFYIEDYCAMCGQKIDRD